MNTSPMVEAMEVEPVVMPQKPNFKPLKAKEMLDGGVQFHKIPVPFHRRAPLYNSWEKINDKVYNKMNVDIRMNVKARQVELKPKPDTPEIDHLQKSVDYIHSSSWGLNTKMLSLYCDLTGFMFESFEIKDVKTLRGEQLSRAIGRLSRKSGSTKFAIENGSRTRTDIADTNIHILGDFSRIKIAKNCMCSLIMGSPAAKGYSKLRLVCSKLD